MRLSFNNRAWLALVCALISACPASEKDGKKSNDVARCTAGQMLMCACPDGRALPVTCAPNGQVPACPCFGNSGPGGVFMPTGMLAGAGGMTGMSTGTGGMTGMPSGAGGVMSMLPGTGGSMSPGGMLPGTGGMTGGMLPGTGGMSAMSAGTGGMPAGTGGTSGAAGAGGTNDLEMVRQICIDTLNMYRATVMLDPVTRGSMSDETCSDMGAKQDADNNTPHSSAGNCAGYGGQDTCPGWPIGGFSGNATLADALKNCLAQMWAEGPPPNGRDACIADRSGCFQMHGHYINMSEPRYTKAACGFYEMSDGKWWMNQNFGY
jgi:hypothetical protein